jgi:2,4-dienoyl-CoA reductase-like NADH-dependent reductase (Old Yellow Enzyme family)
VSAVQIKIPDPVEILFKPTRIGGMDLRNRIVMAPMTRAMTSFANFDQSGMNTGNQEVRP